MTSPARPFLGVFWVFANATLEQIKGEKHGWSHVLWDRQVRDDDGGWNPHKDSPTTKAGSRHNSVTFPRAFPLVWLSSFSGACSRPHSVSSLYGFCFLRCVVFFTPQQQPGRRGNKKRGVINTTHASLWRREMLKGTCRRLSGWSACAVRAVPTSVYHRSGAALWAHSMEVFFIGVKPRGGTLSEWSPLSILLTLYKSYFKCNGD